MFDNYKSGLVNLLFKDNILKIKAFIFTFIFLFSSMAVSKSQVKKGIKIKILKIEENKSFILLNVVNYSNKKINLENENDIIFAIDQNRRQTFGSFLTSENNARSLNLDNYNYNCTINPGKSKRVYIFFDPRMNFNLNKMKMLVYHFNGMKFKLT